VSIGACERNAELDDPAVVMERADKRLYISKRAGRDRVTLKG
jgi:GGDEF domain-containing protein